jgi:hypothetical protein
VPGGFLTEGQKRSYGCYASQPSPEQLDRFFYLDNSDRRPVGLRRGAHNRLGSRREVPCVTKSWHRGASREVQDLRKSIRLKDSGATGYRIFASPWQPV